MKIYDSAEMLIGKTPLLRMHGLEKHFNLVGRLYGKLEFLNPGGSVKDRAAKTMIDEAEKSGRLKKGAVIIEPTSGNTGIGLALVAALRGYSATIVMPDSMSVERIRLMKAYGAEVVLTEGKYGMAGAIRKAQEICDNTPNSIIMGQFDNEDNANAHFETTGPEIYNALDSEVDIFVSAVGTGGTITGTGRFLKSKKPDVEIVAVEPLNSPYLTEGRAGVHKIQGIGAGFVPAVLDTAVYDRVITVSDEEAFEYARIAAKSDGVLVGISSGAALCAAVKLAELKENKDKNIVVILPDTGSRYLSGDLFES